jgi:hypothetical protein
MPRVRRLQERKPSSIFLPKVARQFPAVLLDSMLAEAIVCFQAWIQ